VAVRHARKDRNIFRAFCNEKLIRFLCHGTSVDGEKSQKSSVNARGGLNYSTTVFLLQGVFQRSRMRVEAPPAPEDEL
jgi:hypothetical protein